MACKTSILADPLPLRPGRRGCSAATDRFDLHRARWEALPPLASPRCDAAAVAKGSVVFLLGRMATEELGGAKGGLSGAREA